MQFEFLAKRYGLCAAMVLIASLPAEAALTIFTDRATFEAATSDLTNLNFEGIVPPDSTQNYPNPDGLMTDGFTFRTSGIGPSGTGLISIYGALAAAQSAVLNTGTGAILVWTPPDQPGTAYLDVLLPGGKTAFAADIWAQQPFVTTVRAIVNSGEATENIDFDTVDRSAPYFFGVTSDANTILLVRFAVSAGQVGLILDNVSAGVAGGSTNPIPEPGAMVLLGAGLASITMLRRFRGR